MSTKKKHRDTGIGFSTPLSRETLENTNFRKVLFTGKHAQLVVMCLEPGEDIGAEVHADVDQFFRVEQGEARFVFNHREERLAWPGDAVVVEAGTLHNVFNPSTTSALKLSTIYSPPNHPDGTIQATKAEAEAAEVAAHR